jgi:hypothetical protein
MLVIDPSIMVHKLNVDPDYWPVKEKRRSYAPERNKAAVEEDEKLLQAHSGSIRPELVSQCRNGKKV